MKLAYVIAADAAEVSTTGKISLLGGEIEEIYTTNYPVVQFGLTFVIKLFFDPDELQDNPTYTFEATIIAPDGTNITPDLVSSFTPKQLASNTSRQVPFRLIVKIPVIIFPEEGEYICHFTVDHTELGTLLLSLKPPPQSQAID